MGYYSMDGNTSLTVSEVCCRPGFNNLNYFIRQFKRIVGLTPTAFRVQ